MKRRIVRVVLVFVLLFSAVVFMGTVRLEAQGTPVVYVDPPSSVVPVGQNTTVAVKVANVTDLYGYDIWITYNSSILEVTGTSVTGPGQVVPSNPSQYYFYDNSISGTVKVGVGFRESEGALSFNGNGTMAWITFNATNMGNTTLHFDPETGLYDSEALSITHTTQDGSVTVGEPLPQIYVGPPEYTTQLGETFTTAVNVSDVIGLYGYELWVSYNATILQVNNLTERGPTQVVPQETDNYTIDDTSVYGTVKVSVVFVEVMGAESFNGSGTLVWITFNGTAEGNSTIDIIDAETTLYDKEAVEITMEPPVDGFVTVLAQARARAHYVQSHISEGTTSYDDNDPQSQTYYVSGEANWTFSSPDANGVLNLSAPKGGGTKSAYNPITNTTGATVSISDWHGKMYTLNGTGDVDIISMTNDTETFFKNWTDGTWHLVGEEWLGDGIPDPAGSAWATGMVNLSLYQGNGTDGPLIGSHSQQIWITTGFSENTVVEPNSRLDGFYVNATGVPFSPPFVGTIGTWVYTRAKLNIPWLGKHLDSQFKTDQCMMEPPVFIASLFSPANLYVTDPENYHIGTDPTTGEYVNEIDGAFYSGPGSEPQRVVIPDPLDGVYDIKIVGTGTGEYTSVVEYATEEKITTDTYTGNIASGQIWENEANISEGEMTSTQPVLASQVGGIYIPVDKLSLLAPYIGLTILLAVAVMTIGYVKKRKRDTEINS